MKKEILKLIKNNKMHMFIYFLLVFIVSISLSYAYFTSNINASGNGILAKGDIEDVSTARVEAEAIVNMSVDNMYPGHTEISSIKVIGTGNNKPIVYNLIFKGTNTFTSNINYKVYKTTSNIDASYICNKKTTIQNGVQILSEECIGNNIDLLGSVVTSGTINQSIGESKQILLSDEIILTSEEGEEVYYYIVIEYPNLNESQNTDIISSINGNITIEESSTKYQEPQITYAISTTAGNNDWYKAVSIGGSISGSGTSYTGKYCITTNNSCTPDTNLTITDKTISNITLSNNTTAQRVCMTIIDNYNQEATSCSDSYKVDNTKPTTSIAINTQTLGSNSWYQALSLKVTGSDTYSGVSSIKYCTTTSTSCTPTTAVSGSSATVTLSSNASSQRVCALSIDNTGNTSSTICSSAYSVDTTNPSVTASVASSTVGSNSWYKAISIKGTGSDSHSGVSSIKYCTTTSSSCTPTTSVSGSSSTVALSSNASAQRVCFQAIDNSGRSSTISCSSAYYVDNTIPTVSIASSSSTTNSITVSVSGSDSHSGIATYYYSSNNGASYVSSTSNSYTFSSLAAGTTYTIKVYVVDWAGNQSTVVSKSVATQTPTASQTILANITYKTTTPDFSKAATTDEGVYAVSDGMYGGTSYYWRGAVTNNYVTFAGFCWRIVRINGDGSIRLIYDGTTCHVNGTSTTDSIAVTSQKYNASYNSSVYVGWSYTKGEQHGTGTASNARSQVETWYTSNLASYENFIADGKYCNDREVASEYTWSYVNSGFHYAASGRLTLGKTPTLSCTNTSDVFTVKIGLITADEVSFAGGVYGTNNSSYYLYNGNTYWTMSPAVFYVSNHAHVFYVSTNGLLDWNIVNDSWGLRPVINLNADIIFSSGTGTQTSPYVVKTT